jgi:L-rhamnose isomerase
MMNKEQAFEFAVEQYAELGVEVETALVKLANVALSIHCWQGDDVGGFESPEAELAGGGLAVTGNYPGRARTPDELRQDLEQTLSLLPGLHRVNLHAMYGDFGGKNVDRNRIAPEHFVEWIDWARELAIGLDFNATCFSHPKAESGFTLSDCNPEVRAFWVEHVSRCREIGAWMGEALGTPCLHNLWIPDGSKDVTVGRSEHRAHLRESLDAIYATKFPVEHLVDSVESKLFGLGSESFVVGSHDFYLAWVAGRDDVRLCLDMGHYHPTESIADKISALAQFLPGLVVHVSRGVRWDSDHVVILDDPLKELMQEIVRAGQLEKTILALDFFDASINRVGAWVIGARAALQAILLALLEPTEKLRTLEAKGDLFGRMALLERMKALPFGTVWEMYCQRNEVATSAELPKTVKTYEKKVLSKRR